MAAERSKYMAKRKMLEEETCAGNAQVRLPAVLALALLAASTCVAKDCVFQLVETGGSGTTAGYYWSNSNNWVGCQKPVSGDSVYITNMTSANVYHDISGLTLAHFEYICKGASLVGVYPITLTGTDNIVSNTASYYELGVYNIAENARLTYCGTATAQAAKDGVWSGPGELAVWMGGNKTSFHYSFYHSGFTGIVNIYRGNTLYFGGCSTGRYGFPNAVINVYGNNSAAETNSGFHNAKTENAVLYGEYHFYHKQSFYSEYRTIFDGDVYLHADSNNDIFQFNPYARTSPKAGFTFNGKVYKCPDGVQARMVHYTYGETGTTGHNDSIVEFNGGGEFGSRGIEFSFQNGGTGAFIRVSKPISWQSSNSSLFLTFGDAVRLYTLAPNVLPTSNATMALGRTNGDTRGALLDLMGNDQTTGGIYYYGPSNGYVLDAVFTSSCGPATLDMLVAPGGAGSRNLPTLSGQISVKVRGSNTNAGAYNHLDGDTTGWIKSDGWASFVCSNSLPNIAGFEMVGKGVLYLNADATLNSAMELNLHDLTNNASGLCSVCVESGSNRTVGRVLYDFVDVPAGTYCRVGAGVADATEAAWMKGNASYNGTITVAAHNPLFVWTGKGADGSLATGANWAGSTAPDISSATTTIDFRYASAEKPVTLSGTVAPACAIADATPFDKGALTFDGDGSLVLSGSGVVTNGWAFIDHASLVWNGPGTLVLAGASATSGTVSVVAGKVVLAAGQWLGGADIAANAELEVESSCGSEVFGADDLSANHSALAVGGKLTLGEGVAACVKSMSIGGTRVYGRKTHGSSSSGAMCQDDEHFGGTGTAMPIVKAGFMLYVE